MNLGTSRPGNSMVVDPASITRFDLTTEELEEHLLFWILAAGKPAFRMAAALEKLLVEMQEELKSSDRQPFEMIRCLPDALGRRLLSHGVGCYNQKARTFIAVANARFDLRTCSADDLITIPGIGLKTSRCFILHSREDSPVAGLDTHMLKHLRELGFTETTYPPRSKAEYERLETIVLGLAQKSGLSPAAYDLHVWKSYAIPKTEVV